MAKWDASGNQQWIRTKEDTDFRSEPALALAVDRHDEIIAVGHTQVKIVGIKYDASGTEQWRSILGGNGNVSRAFAVALDSQDRPIAAGFTTDNSNTDQHFAVVWLCTNCR